MKVQNENEKDQRPLPRILNDEDLARGNGVQHGQWCHLLG
jgi:hypothetical protein